MTPLNLGGILIVHWNGGGNGAGISMFDCRRNASGPRVWNIAFPILVRKDNRGNAPVVLQALLVAPQIKRRVQSCSKRHERLS